MSYSVKRTAQPEAKHVDDVESCLVCNGRLYTGSDDGFIKCWDSELELVHEWRAHQYVVYDLAADPERNLLYSCSMDGEIKLWSLDSPATCLMTALQTGPTGEGAEMGAMGGLPASLEKEVVTVRKILFWRDKLYAGDEMGGLCRWSSDLSTCELKKEYFTEIWSLALTDQGQTVITARDNELVAADLSPSSTVLVSYTMPGRAPVTINAQEDLMVCPDRGGMKIIVRRREGNKYVESQMLARHDMIVNSLVMRGDILLSGGWDCRAVVWRRQGDQFQHVQDVELESYINTMCPGPGQSFFIGGKKGYLVKIDV